MNRTLIEQTVGGHEGNRLVVYKDTRGNLTIGKGFNLDADGALRICVLFGIDYVAILNGAPMTQAQVDEVFEYQLSLVIGQAMLFFPNFLAMPDGVQAAVCDQIFEMGLPRFMGFVNEIAALRAGNYPQAAKDALDSEWARQVPNRAADDAKLLEAA